MIDIGDKVESGIISAIWDAKLYASVNSHYCFEEWSRLDKDWINKKVYYVELDNPVKQMSIEQLQNKYPEKSYLEIEKMHSLLPFVTIMAVPEFNIHSKKV